MLLRRRKHYHGDGLNVRIGFYFLQHLDYLGLVLGARVEVLQQFAFDHTLLVRINGEHERHLSQKISQYVLVQPAGGGQ